MNREDIVRAAEKAAGTVYGGKKGSWFAALNAPDEDLTVEKLAKLMAAIGKDASAEIAYRHAVGVDVEDRPWEDAPKNLVAALQVFVATHGALLQIALVDEAREASEAAEVARQPVPEAMAERNMTEQVPSLAERVEGLTPPAVSGAAPELTDEQKESLVSGVLGQYPVPEPTERLPIALIDQEDLIVELDELKRAFAHVSDAGGTPDEEAFERACAIEVELGKRRGVGVTGSSDGNDGGQAA